MQFTSSSMLSGLFKTGYQMQLESFLSLMSIFLLKTSAISASDMEFQHLGEFKVFIGFFLHLLEKSMITKKTLKVGFWTELSRLQLMKLGICLAMAIAYFTNAWCWEPTTWNKLIETQSFFAQSATESYGNVWSSIMSRDTQHSPNALRSLVLPLTSHKSMKWINIQSLNGLKSEEMIWRSK